MKTSEVLRAAKARIDTPDRWWNGNPGRSPGEGRCAVLTIKAIVGNEVIGHPATKALARAMDVDFPIGNLIRWNDAHTHAQLMAAYDEAIVNAETREQEFAVEPITESEYAVA